jgi:hypothetical protein
VENSRQKAKIVRGYGKEWEGKKRSGLNRKPARREGNNPLRVTAIGIVQRFM